MVIGDGIVRKVKGMRIDKFVVWINMMGYFLVDFVVFVWWFEGWGYGILWINDGMGSDLMVLVVKILFGIEWL